MSSSPRSTFSFAPSRTGRSLALLVSSKKSERSLVAVTDASVPGCIMTGRPETGVCPLRLNGVLKLSTNSNSLLLLADLFEVTEVAPAVSSVTLSSSRAVSRSSFDDCSSSCKIEFRKIRKSFLKTL